jgi:hypothetical protein
VVEEAEGGAQISVSPVEVARGLVVVVEVMVIDWLQVVVRVGLGGKEKGWVLVEVVG